MTGFLNFRDGVGRCVSADKCTTLFTNFPMQRRGEGRTNEGQWKMRSTINPQGEEPPETAGDIFPRFSGAGPGPYRVRVHARGRDATRNGSAEAEEHLIRAWSAPIATETVFQASDQCGASFRS